VDGRTILVFGSNLAGRHGAGSALEAVNHWGAAYGYGEGLHGNSYAIPTKDYYLRTMSLLAIRCGVETFLAFARNHPTWRFLTVKIGCGLAGYSWERDILPMFENKPDNVVFVDAAEVRRARPKNCLFKGD
jgi:hypothetical protein